jgi:hypothetical protein
MPGDDHFLTRRYAIKQRRKMRFGLESTYGNHIATRAFPLHRISRESDLITPFERLRSVARSPDGNGASLAVRYARKVFAAVDRRQALRSKAD